MKEKALLIIKGFVFGLANIIPGVSGGTIALTMGVYESLISSIGHFFERPKECLKFLIPFGIGAVLSILLMSKLISFSLAKYPLPTTLFFTGLILGGIPLLTRKVKGSMQSVENILLFFIPFCLIIIMNFIKIGNGSISLDSLSVVTFFLLFIVGVIAAITMVVPGVSGSFVLMLLGFYKPLVNTVSKLTDFSLVGHNLLVLIPFGIGVLLGTIFIAKLIEKLFKKYKIKTYCAILGFVVASVIVLIISAFSANISLLQLLVGSVLFVISTILGYKLGDD